MIKHIHQLALRPYLYRELPGWGRLYSKFIGGHCADSSWRDLPPRIIRGKLHGYEMELNLGAWSERQTYFLGRFYDLPTQLLFKAIVRPGDRVLDCGANIGMLTLLASYLVGGSGRVDSIEPNPQCANRIKWALARNAITNVVVHEVALGEVDGAATLSIPEWNTGEASLASMEGAHGQAVRTLTVPILRCSEIIAFDPRVPRIIKIDVEGFELSVLSGLEKVLKESRPFIVTEVVDEHLVRAGRSATELFQFLGIFGYQPFGISTRRAGFGRRLTLQRCDAANHPSDVAWVPSGSEMLQTLQPHITK